MSTTTFDFPATVEDALEQLRQIPEAKTFPVSERLTAFFFMLLDSMDALDDDAAILGKTFNKQASGFTSAFHEALRHALTEVTEAQDVPGVNRIVADTAPARFVVAEMLVQLLSTSLHDDSEDRLRSAALADKMLAYAASVLSSPVPQKAVDVVRYAVEAGYLPVDRIPIVSDWFGSDEKS